MLLRHARFVAVMSLLLLSSAAVAGAEVLWDQSDWDTRPTNSQEGSINLSSNACSQISGNTKVHTACDVHFDNPVHITTVRVYETFGNVQTATLAYLWIRAKTGPLPTTPSDSLELAAIQVSITPVTETIGTSQCVRVSATGLDIELPAGDYWVSLTPRHNIGVFPWTFHLASMGAVVGDQTVAIEACTVNSNWFVPTNPTLHDYAMKIEGEFHGPTAGAPTGQRGEAPGP